MRRKPGKFQTAATPGERKEGSNTMLVLRYLLVILGIGLLGSSGALVVYDIRSEERRVGKSVDLGGRRIIKKKIKERRVRAGGESWLRSKLTTRGCVVMGC